MEMYKGGKITVKRQNTAFEYHQGKCEDKRNPVSTFITWKLSSDLLQYRNTRVKT